MGLSAGMSASLVLLTVLSVAHGSPTSLRGKSNPTENANVTDVANRRLDVTCPTKTCTGDFVLDWEKTKTAFVAAGGSTSSLPTEATLKTYTKSACIHDEKEFAMFFANLMQESDKLTATAEYNHASKKSSYDWGENKDGKTCDRDGEKGCHGSNCSSKCKVHYYGRGYLQTTWRENYAKAYTCGGCDSKNIVVNPDEVASSKALSWCTTAYYWRTAVHLDRCPNGGESCDLGNTIHAINAEQECGANAAHKAEARQRYCYYAKFYKSYSDIDPWADSVCISDLGQKYNDGLC